MTPTWTRVYIGIGSNIDDPIQHIKRSFEELAQLTQSEWVRASKFYQSKPHGPQNQPDFINAVATIDTRLSPEALLLELQAIEAQHGRNRTETRWGARPLDLDILLYGNETLCTRSLIIPHLHLKARPFCLIPLYEIAPELVFPDGTQLKTFVEKLLETDCTILTGSDKGSSIRMTYVNDAG